MEIIKKNFEEAQKILQAFCNKKNYSNIERAANLILKAIKNGKKIISCGNGGSMCDAMHFAEELTGRFKKNRDPIAALAISDPAHLSCVANDYGYDQAFSRYIEAIGQEGDVLLAISTSGNSENIYQAVNIAKSKKMVVIGLTGGTISKISNLCDIIIMTPSSEFSDRIQEIHIKIIHSIIDHIEQELEQNHLIL